MTTKKTLSIGSVSHGTMREEDLIPAFMDLLESVDKSRYDELNKELSEIDEMAEGDDKWDAISTFLNETLWNTIDEHCPPFCYFGAHPGDGSDYGVWPSIDALEEAAHYNDGVIKVDAGDEWPKDLGGADFVAEVNDHGNLTLFDAHTREELWAIV